MKQFGFGEIACIVGVFCVAAAIASPAQTFSTVLVFDGTDGADVPAALIQGIDGNFYGVTENAGNPHGGTVFMIAPSGKLTTLHDFCSETNCADGEYPTGALVQTVNGTLYGTTMYGGANDDGSVFEITPPGEFTTLYSFCSATNCSDGSVPNGIVLGATGNFYGTTYGGGTSGNGTIFEITPAGKLTTLYSFCAAGNPCQDGANPESRLAEASNGKFYGTTWSGGTGPYEPGGGGVVFEITAAGKFTTLYSFCSQVNCVDGSNPIAGLVQARNGNLYGTTYFGGSNCVNGGGCGTVYEITPAGNLSTLYNFCSQTNCSDGLFPVAGLVQAADGNFYGTANQGGLDTNQCLDGTASCGTIFKITPEGTLTALYSFCSQTGCADGANPKATLLQATDGTFYGSTFLAGDATCPGGVGCGTIFSLSVGLGPFVQANPGFGKVGQVVNILGNDLTGTSRVTFNGTTAEFEVISGTYLKAEVPSGAATGKIEVTTPSGTLASDVSFQVLP